MLTERLAIAPGFVRDDGCRCLVGVVRDIRSQWDNNFTVECKMTWNEFYQWNRVSVGTRFDGLCRRFGEPRINAAIRNRILSNRARRVLAAVPQEAACLSS